MFEGFFETDAVLRVEYDAPVEKVDGLGTAGGVQLYERDARSFREPQDILQGLLVSDEVQGVDRLAP